MNANKLPALRTLVKIRLKRQEVLDGLKIQARAELDGFMESRDSAATALDIGTGRVEQQAAKLEALTKAGASFQVSEYLAEQDFLDTLSAESALLQSKLTAAELAVVNQDRVLKEARLAASRNEKQREQLLEKIASLLAEIDIAQMDRQDEEAEEANIVLTRRRQQEADDFGGASNHA